MIFFKKNLILILLLLCFISNMNIWAYLRTDFHGAINTLKIQTGTKYNPYSKIYLQFVLLDKRNNWNNDIGHHVNNWEKWNSVFSTDIIGFPVSIPAKSSKKLHSSSSFVKNHIFLEGADNKIYAIKVFNYNIDRTNFIYRNNGWVKDCSVAICDGRIFETNYEGKSSFIILTATPTLTTLSNESEVHTLTQTAVIRETYTIALNFLEADIATKTLTPTVTETITQICSINRTESIKLIQDRNILSQSYSDAGTSNFNLFATNLTIIPTSSSTVTENPIFTATMTTVEAFIEDDIVVYPNPFNHNIFQNGKMKFCNLPIGAKIMIYTISGEFVTQFTADSFIMFWDGRNYTKNLVSKGIYFYIISCNNNRRIKKGLIFIF